MRPEWRAILERLAADDEPDGALLAAADELPADLLAEQLSRADRLGGCNLAHALARRHDPRGVAALARAATVRDTAARALAGLRALDMLDMLPPEFRTAAWEDEVVALATLGAEPEELELLHQQREPWPGLGPTEVALYRYRLGSELGLLLLRPVRRRIAGGVSGLDAYDCLCLACGACFDSLAPLPLEQVPAERVINMLKRRAYRRLTESRLAAARRRADEPILVVAARSGGKPGYLVGGAQGLLPLHWIAVADEKDPLSADQAFWIWYGRMLLAGLR